jgi:hypothetical protein
MTPAMRDRLTDDGRRRLCHELLGRLREYARRPPGSALQAVVAVDDALHIHVAAPGSWWHGLSRRRRALVDQRAKSVQAAGHQVDVQPLLLDYRGCSTTAASVSTREATTSQWMPVVGRGMCSRA